MEELRDIVNPGLLALVRAEGCNYDVLDNWPENTLRRPLIKAQTTRRCRSNCQPHSVLIQQFKSIMVDLSVQVRTASNSLSPDNRDAVRNKLRQLREQS